MILSQLVLAARIRVSIIPQIHIELLGLLDNFLFVVNQLNLDYGLSWYSCLQVMMLVIIGS